VQLDADGAILCSFFLCHRNRNRPPTDKQTDLSGEYRNEGQFEDDHLFDLDSDAEGTDFEDLTGSHSLARGRPHGGSDLRIYFHGEECFWLLGV
jgi:hypothetical protein